MQCVSDSGAKMNGVPTGDKLVHLEGIHQESAHFFVTVKGFLCLSAQIKGQAGVASCSSEFKHQTILMLLSATTICRQNCDVLCLASLLGDTIGW